MNKTVWMIENADGSHAWTYDGKRGMKYGMAVGEVDTDEQGMKHYHKLPGIIYDSCHPQGKTRYDSWEDCIK